MNIQRFGRLESGVSVDAALGKGPTTVVRLAGIGTVVPKHELPQALVRRAAERIFGDRYPDFARLARSYETAGVERRYSICPFEWFDEPKTWPERTERYLDGATTLFAEAAEKALASAGIAASEIDTVVTVSSTGIATPTLEARAFDRVGFRRDVHRVPLFGLGCAGGVSGLAIARRLALAAPGSRVLLVCVETCSLSFREDRLTKADIIASVLFGDGAAAVCLVSGPDSAGRGPVVGEGVEHTWQDTLGIMGWEMDATGFGVVFDRSIPSFVEAHFRDAAIGGLDRMGLAEDDITRFVCHPGGKKVVEAIEQSLGLAPGVLDHEREILRDYGNMSAPTVLFVLERVMAAEADGQTVLMALGPGFTASMIPVAFED